MCETAPVIKDAVRLIHKMAARIKCSHGGWYEAYATAEDLAVITISDTIKKLKGE